MTHNSKNDLARSSQEVLIMPTINSFLIVWNREALLKWKAQYSWPPCTNQFRSTAFDHSNIIYFFTKQASSMRRSTVLSRPIHLVFPVLSDFQKVGWSWRVVLSTIYHLYYADDSMVKCINNWKARFKNVTICLNTNIYSYLETSGGQSSNLYLNVVHFFNTSVH